MASRPKTKAKVSSEEAETLRQLRAFAKSLGVSYDEFQHWFRSTIIGLMRSVEDGEITSAEELLGEEMQATLMKEALDAGVNFGQEVPEGDEAAQWEWDQWNEHFQTNFDRFMGALAITLFY
jgi:hypothetical protein